MRGSDIISEATIDSITGGQSVQKTATFAALSGQQDIVVVVDPDNAIPESSENNNRATKSVTGIG